MRLRRLVFGAGVLVLVGACSDSGFGRPRGSMGLTVELVGQQDTRVVGSPFQPLPLAINSPQPFRIIVRAVNLQGDVETSFNGFVRISAKPGAIERIEGSPDADGRNIRLTNGVSPEFEVELTNAFGTTYILADDIGYVPADPMSSPPPACANGIDDDGDGRIDFPADDGCAFANDDSESGGSYAQGASPPIFYALPRVADVRGLICTTPGNRATCSGSGKTPYPKEQILLDTGFHGRPDGSSNFDFDLVVTRISSSGFYVSDIHDSRGGFNSVFAFNFNSPARMRVCDRLLSFAGTATEFYGFTQISYPTWTLEEWDPQKRPCLVPEPRVLEPIDVTPATLLPLSGSLVRVHTSNDGRLQVKVTPKFGPQDVPEQNGVFVPDVDATNCDFNKDGRIDFSRETEEEACFAECTATTEECTTRCDLNGDGRVDLNIGAREGRCSDACSGDPECTEYSNFLARSTFRLTVTDVNGGAAAIQADASAAADFNPLEMRGKPLKAFSGTLHFFSGGAQYTIEARCKDDIVVDLDAQPLPSDKACVFPRTVLDDTPQ